MLSPSSLSSLPLYSLLTPLSLPLYSLLTSLSLFLHLRARWGGEETASASPSVTMCPSAIRTNLTVTYILLQFPKKRRVSSLRESVAFTMGVIERLSIHLSVCVCYPATGTKKGDKNRESSDNPYVGTAIQAASRILTSIVRTNTRVLLTIQDEKAGADFHFLDFIDLSFSSEKISDYPRKRESICVSVVCGCLSLHLSVCLSRLFSPLSSFSPKICHNRASRGQPMTQGGGRAEGGGGSRQGPGRAATFPPVIHAYLETQSFPPAGTFWDNSLF